MASPNGGRRPAAPTCSRQPQVCTSSLQQLVAKLRVGLNIGVAPLTIMSGYDRCYGGGARAGQDSGARVLPSPAASSSTPTASARTDRDATDHAYAWWMPAPGIVIIANAEAES